MSDLHNARYVRRTWLTMAAMLLAFPFCVWGTLQGMRRLNDDAIGWTASDLPARQNLAWFTRHFGSQNAVMVSWPGATLFDPRLEQFAAALRATTNGDGSDPAWLRDVVTGADVYAELTAPPLGCSDQEAIRRLRGTFLGPDGRTCCAVVVLSEDAAMEARHAVATIAETAQRAAGIGAGDVRMVGYVVETATLDAAALDTLYWLSIPSAALVILIAWPCLSNLRLALLVWLSATFCQCFCLAMVYYHSGQLNGMMTVLPILISVIFISSAVHLVNYYQDAVRNVGVAAAPARALAAGWFPCLLAVGTSAIGVGSLAMSRTAPVRSFGGYAAVAIAFTLLILLLVMPGGMHLTCGRNAATHGQPTRPTRRRADRSRWWTLWGSWVERHSTSIVLGCAAATVFAALGLGRLKGSMQLTDFLPNTSRTTQDHLWFQRNIGPLLPVEMVLRFDRSSTLSVIDRLRLVDALERAVRAMPQQTSSISLAAFLPKPDGSPSVRATVQRSIFNRLIEAQRAKLASNSPYLADTGAEELWRVTVRLEGLTGQDYQAIVADLQRAVAPVLREAQQRPGSGLSVVYTGTLPLLAESHPTILRDLVVSFSTSLLAIGVVLIVGLRSVRLGLVSILPNVFPIVLVFGALGWLGRTIDVGSMMTASVGLGIAVDGTVHYLTWFLRGIRAGLPRHAAILDAYRHSATAMLRTTAICGGGLAVYGVSSFLPAARFGWIVCALLLTALAGDLLLLPALLAGHLGKVLFPDGETSGSGKP